MPSLTTRQLPGKSERKAVQEGQLEPGTILQGRYQVVGVLGVGGMGSVYQARDLRFPNVTKLCAVKEMMNLAADPQMRKLIVQNFEREANILATLDHPAVPEIFDYFSEDNRSFLVMEFIAGKSLEELLESSEELLEEELVLEWSLQICNVLGYLHSNKPNPIIFRDLKPSNIMLDHHDRIRMIDFGIAKVFQSGERGTMIGTEGYSPPEQYRGEAGPASDVYSLGATLHAMLTRQDPRLEPPFSFAERPIRGINPEVSPTFEAIVTKALSYNTEDRFPSAIEMGEAVQTLYQRTASIAFPSSAAKTRTRTQHLVSAYQISPENVIPLWSFRCEDEIRSTPVVVDGRAFVGAYDNNLYAINVDNGQFVWKYATAGGIASSPAVWNNRVFFGSEDGAVYALDASTGQLVWSFGTRGPVYSSPRVGFEHVFVGSDDGHLYAINATTGREVWRVHLEGRVRSSVAFGDDLLYVGCEEGLIHGLQLDGKSKWRYLTKRGVTSSPVVADGLVIVGSQDWSVYAVDAVTGWSVWRFRTRKPIISSPCAHEGIVYIGSADGVLYAIDLGTGQRRWAYESDSQITSSPLVHLNSVYFGGINGAVYSLEISRGELRWRFHSNGPVPGSPIGYEDIILIGSSDGHLYALPA